jgi:hypothetical protein
MYKDSLLATLRNGFYHKTPASTLIDINVFALSRPHLLHWSHSIRVRKSYTNMASVKRNDSEDMQVEKSDIQVIENAGGMDGLDSIEDTKPGAFVWLCAAATAIGGMLFGCKYCICHESHSITDKLLKTTPVSSQVSLSCSEQISAARRSQTPRRKPSLLYALQER